MTTSAFLSSLLRDRNLSPRAVALALVLLELRALSSEQVISYQEIAELLGGGDDQQISKSFEELSCSGYCSRRRQPDGPERWQPYLWRLSTPTADQELTKEKADAIVASVHQVGPEWGATGLALWARAFASDLVDPTISELKAATNSTLRTLNRHLHVWEASGAAAALGGRPRRFRLRAPQTTPKRTSPAKLWDLELSIPATEADGRAATEEQREVLARIVPSHNRDLSEIIAAIERNQGSKLTADERLRFVLGPWASLCDQYANDEHGVGPAVLKGALAVILGNLELGKVKAPLYGFRAYAAKVVENEIAGRRIHLAATAPAVADDPVVLKETVGRTLREIAVLNSQPAEDGTCRHPDAWQLFLEEIKPVARKVAASLFNGDQRRAGMQLLRAYDQGVDFFVGLQHDRHSLGFLRHVRPDLSEELERYAAEEALAA
jgi:hypothetical protein